MTILKKVVPLYFNEKSRKLYFDAIESFDDTNFIFLKKSKTPMSTHFIKINEEYKNMSNNRGLTSLIKNIEKRVLNKTIVYGKPLGMSIQDNILREIKEDDYEKNDIKLIKELHSKCSTLIVPPFVSSGTKTLINVGQGLCFVDNENFMIYDAGGTKLASNVSFGLLRNMKYNVVISHYHHDHYKYLMFLLQKNIVKNIFIHEGWPETMSWKNIRDLCSRKNISILFHNKIERFMPYDAFLPVAPKTVNEQSVVLRSKNWILTGDQTTKNITDLIGVINIENFQIPHHLSGSSEQNPSKLMIRKIEKAHFSCSKYAYKNMPNELYKNEYESIGATMVPTIPGITYK